MIARATNGETFAHAQIKEMIERAAHTTFYVGLTVVEGDKVRSKTKAVWEVSRSCFVSSASLQKSASSTSAFFATLRFR